MKQKNSILRGATSLGIGAFISKLIGAIYRVPLTNIIGGVGLGLYQMVFPVYAILLDFSGAGVPSALSKLISSEREKREYSAQSYLNTSIRVLLMFGLICSAIMAIAAKPLAKIQGDESAYIAYLFLAPAITFVSLISCFRGYFQGLMKMGYTATSQIVEQVIKLCFGLLFAFIFKQNIPLAVGGATLAISISEIVALVYLVISYKRHKKANPFAFVFSRKDFFNQAKTIIKTTVPITLIGIMIPLSQVIDSFLIINLIKLYREDGTLLYGLFSGVVMTLINLPVSICYGVSTSTIPAVSGAKDVSEQNKNAIKALLLTALVSVGFWVGLAYFSDTVIGMLFGRLSVIEREITRKLLLISCPCILLLSILQTSNAVLIGKGKLYSPLLSMFLGVVVKTILNILLLSVPSINIYGSAVAVIACYFVACLVNLIMILKTKVANESKRTYRREYAS